jgi:hypothetical protein
VESSDNSHGGSARDLARTDTRGVLQRVQDKKFWQGDFLAKCGCGVLTCTKRFVNLVGNARRLASPRQAHDAQ